jgi:hypothetical protein
MSTRMRMMASINREPELELELELELEQFRSQEHTLMIRRLTAEH